MADIVIEPLRKALIDIVSRAETNDVTVRQLCVFLSIAKGPCTIRDIAAEVPLTKAAISRAGDWLERLGFANRHDDPQDRRSVLLALTPQGKRFLASLAKSKSA